MGLSLRRQASGRRPPSLRSWLTLLIVCTTGPLLLVAGVAFTHVLAARDAERTRTLQERTRNLTAAVDAEVRVWTAVAAALAESSDLRAGRWAAFHAQAARVAAEHGGWVVVTDPRLQQILNTLRPYGAPLPTASPVIRTIFEARRPVVLGPYDGALVKDLIVAVGVPVIREGAAAYALHLNFRLPALSQLLAQQHLPATWSAAIVDRDGRVMGRAHEADLRLGTPSKGWQPAAAETAPSGVVPTVMADGRHVQMAFQRLTEAPWVLALAAPTAELQSTVPAAAFLSAIVLLVLLALAAAVYLSRKIAAPVVALAEHSVAIVAGTPPHAVAGRAIVREVVDLKRALREAGAQVRASYEAHERAAVAEQAAQAALSAAEAIRASEEKFNRAFQNNPASLVLARLGDGRILDVNQTFLVLSGFTRGDVVGRTAGELEIWKHQEDRRTALDRLHATGRFRDAEVQLVTKTGQDVTVLLSAELMPVAGEAVILASFVDITARRQAEEALRQSERRVRAFFESPMVGTLCWSIDGQIADANDKFLQMVGYSREDLRAGRVNWTRMTPHEYRPRDEHALAELHATGVETPYEKEFIRKDGTRLPVLVGGATLDPNRHEGVAFVLDMTARKHAEAERQRGEEQLRAALHEKEAALADREILIKEVHHRTKNNLQMLCSLLELQADAIESPEGKAALEESTTRIYAIARLYEQLYRSMSGGQVVLCEYLQGLAQTFQTTYSRHGITLTLPPLNGIYLDVDRAIPCGLIVNELLTNAMKHAFGPETSGTVGIGLEQQDGLVQLRVWDNGRGLPAGLDIKEANSLGLRLVRILAQRLRAAIKVESYEGAAFTLTFPLTTEAPVEPALD